MVGERNIATLSKNMDPRLHAGRFVYCSFSDFSVPEGLTPLCTYREDEGLTVIVDKAQAERLGLPHAFDAALITLNVQSDLSAVGFVAQVTRALSDAGISCNVVSAYHHDHLLVPADRADEAMAVLRAVSELAVAGRTQP